jgi:hypothetical protein
LTCAFVRPILRHCFFLGFGEAWRVQISVLKILLFHDNDFQQEKIASPTVEGGLAVFDSPFLCSKPLSFVFFLSFCYYY